MTLEKLKKQEYQLKYNYYLGLIITILKTLNKSIIVDTHFCRFKEVYLDSNTGEVLFKSASKTIYTSDYTTLNDLENIIMDFNLTKEAESTFEAQSNYITNLAKHGN